MAVDRVVGATVAVVHRVAGDPQAARAGVAAVERLVEQAGNRIAGDQAGRRGHGCGAGAAVVDPAIGRRAQGQRCRRDAVCRLPRRSQTL